MIIITHYCIGCYYILLQNHYYVIITSWLQLEITNHLIMIPLWCAMQRGGFHYYIIISYYFCVIKPGSIITHRCHHYLFQSPKLADNASGVSKTLFKKRQPDLTKCFAQRKQIKINWTFLMLLRRKQNAVEEDLLCQSFSLYQISVAAVAHFKHLSESGHLFLKVNIHSERQAQWLKSLI